MPYVNRGYQPIGTEIMRPSSRSTDSVSSVTVTFTILASFCRETHLALCLQLFHEQMAIRNCGVDPGFCMEIHDFAPFFASAT